MSSFSPFIRDLERLSEKKIINKKERKVLVKVSGEKDRYLKVKHLIEAAAQRIESKIRPKVFRLLYQSEETIFGLVNKINIDVIGPGFSIIPDPDVEPNDKELLETAKKEAKEVEIWSKSKYIKLKRKSSIAFTDTLVYGRGFLELCYNYNKDNILLIHSIDPEDMRYQTKKTSGEVLLDKYGMPEGYVYKEYQGQKELKLFRNEIAHFKMWGLGEPSIGLSPLEPLYNVLKAKMNIEEALAEAIYRRAFPWIVAYCGDKDHEPTMEQIDELHKAISEIEQKTEFTFPYYFKLDKLEPGGVEELATYHKIYSDLIYNTYLMPRGIITGGRKTEVEKGSLQWERSILNYQEILSEIIQEQILDRLYEVKHYKTRPRIVWNIVTPQHQTAYDRSIATLFRHGAIKYGFDTDNYLRKMHNLPLINEEDIDVNEQSLNIIAKKIAEYIKNIEGSDEEKE